MTSFIVDGHKDITVGKQTHIDRTAQVVFSKPGSITIGDYCTVGSGVKIVCLGGDVHIDDWSTIHDNCLLLSSEYLSIGQHCWFGQNCVLDGTGGLKIGNGVRIGMYSQIWSHVAAGEQIEGCTLYGERPVHIEDDVWLVGSCIVASGVNIGRRTIALIGSNITKSWKDNVVLAGSPANVKEALNFYRAIALEEKWSLLEGWIQNNCNSLNFDIEATTADKLQIIDSLGERLIFVRRSIDKQIQGEFPLATVCCVEDKSYNKRYTAIEKRVLKFLAGNKARFYS